ncbi:MULTISPECIES: type II secretion system F family protein [Pseudoalteromonas]|uniref:type II secretion system F family protein n=1 Tax=Pseudoalteromonas TaxID=53246 RepID=UPI00026C9979|nr:type II secretion system F family protein [Pseudoalteromonas spongiae]ATC98656.1 tight adherence protein C [Pseudoalteromonas spongiae UST010723-006]
MVYWILFFFGASICLGIYSVTKIKQEVPEDTRDFMDPLPPSLKIIWPLVKIASYYIGERLPIDYLVKTNKKLQISGLSYIISAEDYFGIRLVVSMICGLMTWFCLSALDSVSLDYIVFALIAGYFLPLVTLSDLKKKRQLKIVKALPVYLDFITMAVEAGLNLTGAIAQSVDKGPDGPLKVEFEKVMRDLRSGVGKIDAFRSMAERVHISEINNLVSALAQAERTGASLGSTLRIQADQRRVERFQRAEKKALEAPVKLVFPLVAFIFPVTFAILFFPIVMKFIYEV